MLHLKLALAALGLAALGIVLDVVTAAQPRQAQPEKNNMELVGYHDLQGRTAYQPLVHKQGDRWIAYVGHHGDLLLNPLNGKQENNGTSILDVTNPKQPKYLAHIPGEPGKAEAGGAQMVRVCDGSTLPQRRQEQGLSAADVRQLRARDLGRHQPGEAEAASR